MARMAAFSVDTAQGSIEDCTADGIIDHIRPAQRLDPFPDRFLGIINRKTRAVFGGNLQ